MGTNYRRSKQSQAALNQGSNQSAGLNPKCDGWFFSQKDRREVFEKAIIEVFNNGLGWGLVTTDTIIDHPGQLIAFSARVFTDLTVSLKEDQVAIDKLTLIKSLDLIDPLTGFSFCNHVAKRLLLLRKAGKLKAKKVNKWPRTPGKKQLGRKSTTIRSVE